MSGHWLHYLWLAYLSKPQGERELFRSIKKNKIRSVVEFGVGDASRAERLIEFARQFVPNGELSYTGIDLFEGRQDLEQGVSLKEAHGRLKRLDAKIKLIPGEPFSALARFANSLAGTDLILISRDHGAEAMDQAWMYLPRMLHENTLILTENLTSSGEEEAPEKWAYVAMERDKIVERAGSNAQHIAKAA